MKLNRIEINTKKRAWKVIEGRSKDYRIDARYLARRYLMALERIIEMYDVIIDLQDEAKALHETLRETQRDVFNPGF